MDKYVYYTISSTEQMFKQLAGFLYFLRYSKNNNKILVLPRFDLKGKKYNFSEFYDVDKVKKSFNVVEYDEYIEASIPNENVEVFDNGFWQFPFTQQDYMEYRKHVRYKKKYYDLAAKTNISDYLAIHWRQTDFLKVRQHSIINLEDLISTCRNTLDVLKLKNVYVATDSTDKFALDYIDKNLPAIHYEQGDMSDIDYAILESLICANAYYFIGTKTSLYSINIMAERINMGKLISHEVYKKLEKM